MRKLFRHGADKGRCVSNDEKKILVCSFLSCLVCCALELDLSHERDGKKGMVLLLLWRLCVAAAFTLPAPQDRYGTTIVSCVLSLASLCLLPSWRH